MKKECYYFSAKIAKENVVTVIALLRSSEDNLCFDRCFDKENSLFEFFVTEGMKKRFIEIINFFEKNNLIKDFSEKK
jgi:hypothetical protein